MNLWPVVSALAQGISQCTPWKWDDVAVGIMVEVVNTAVFLYYVSAPLYNDDGSIITFGYGYMDDYKMGTLIALGGVNILIVLSSCCETQETKDGDDDSNFDEGLKTITSSFVTFLQGLQMMLNLLFTPSNPMRGDVFNILLTIQLWAASNAEKDAKHRLQKPEKGLWGKAKRAQGTMLFNLLTLIQGAIGMCYPFIVMCMTLNEFRDLVYVIPPCQWPENLDKAVAANFRPQMPGILYDPLPSRSDCTMKNSFGWDWVANSSNLTRLVEYSASKNTTQEYGVGPFDPFGNSWGRSSYDFVSREVFTENYDAWAASGLYFNNQTGVGQNSYDYAMALMIIIQYGLAAPMILAMLCTTCMGCTNRVGSEY
jgi:hypothetical protein